MKYFVMLMLLESKELFDKANDPSTPTKELSDLAKHPDDTIVKAVAGNPNTHIDDLRDIFHNRGFEHEVLNNFSWPLYGLESTKTPMDFIMHRLPNHANVCEEVFGKRFNN